LKACLDVTTPDGHLLFSFNHEMLDLTSVTEALELVSQNSLGDFNLVLIPEPVPDLDFEIPPAPRRLKTLLVQKKTHG
jgi:hypothetical protein